MGDGTGAHPTAAHGSSAAAAGPRGSGEGTSLASVLRAIGPCLVAVSGGVDSLTLATAAHRLVPGRVRMLHAVSPAVPPAATARVRALAAREGWSLDTVDAGEFDDPLYRANPADRCFHCKSGLYGTMARHAGGRAMLSGTNTDDLGDWRPGLRAAAAHGVRHPYVEAGMDKAAVRALAGALGLPDIAALPAAPCLSSRIETGLAIRADDLALVDRVERGLRALLPGADLRCRRRARGWEVEIAADALAGAEAGLVRALRAAIVRAAGRPMPLVPYRRGSAFLRETLAPPADARPGGDA